MATWNSRGLRGSALEELVNRTNEKYRENGLALMQKVPTPITPIKMDKEILRLPTLTRRVRSITSERLRESRSALMRKNRQRKPFPCKTSMLIRWLLWKILKSKAVLPFF